MSKPTIIFVPGAWHLPDGYDMVITELKKAGYDSVKVRLPSNGTEPGLQTWDPDVESIKAAISKTVEEGKDAVLVAHSYGSMPADQAVEGFEKKSREQKGLKGGLVSYVYCAAFVMPEGGTLIGALGGNDLPWWSRSQNDTIVNPINPGTIFYNDLDEKTKQSYIEKLLPFSYRMYYQSSKYAAWKHLPSMYIYTTLDNAIPIQVQHGMVEGSGGNFITETVEAGHSPFLSKVAETTLAIRKAAGEKI